MKQLCVYILFSLKDKGTYTGSTDNLEKRLTEHFTGKAKSTRNRRPLKLVHTERYKTLIEARYQEKYYKSCAGRKKLKNILQYIL